MPKPDSYNNSYQDSSQSSMENDKSESNTSNVSILIKSLNGGSQNITNPKTCVRVNQLRVVAANSPSSDRPKSAEPYSTLESPKQNNHTTHLKSTSLVPPMTEDNYLIKTSSLDRRDTDIQRIDFNNNDISRSAIGLQGRNFNYVGLNWFWAEKKIFWQNF